MPALADQNSSKSKSKSIGAPKGALIQWLPALLPPLVIAVSLLPIVSFLLPSTHDGLTESYEPVKTLRFVYSHGAAIHKWGPFPSFILAPVYAVALLVAKLGGHLSKLSAQYPYGFDDPAIQMGHMILAARITVLLIAALSIFYLCRKLQRGLQSTIAPVVALLLCVTTSLVFLEPLADTKPDGMMVSLLIFALANYASIVLNGISLGSALGMAFFYVASLSCKELTSTTMMLPYLGLLISALAARRSNRDDGNRSLRLLLLSMAAIPVFYLLINVVYAPHAWHDRLAYVFGPLKDPAAWASPGQTKLTYLRDTAFAVFASLGWGGIVALLLAVAGTLRRPSRQLFLLWLPFLGHLAFTTYLGGYMPTYFMLPLAPALALPTASIAAQWINSPTAQPEQSRKFLPLIACLSACCLFIGLSATTLFRNTHIEKLMERSIDEQVPPGSVYDEIGLWSTSHPEPTYGPGSRTFDHRALYQLMQAPRSQWPDYLLIAFDTDQWANEIPQRPARAALLKADTNFDYSGFHGFPALGYRLSASTRPELPPWVFPALVAGSHTYIENGIAVYRLPAK